MYYLFLDESGDHNLVKIHKDYPVFVLAGCIVEANNYNNFKNEVIGYKQTILGNPKIILHTADITRNKNGFESLKDKEARLNFYSSLNHLIEKLDFTLIACLVDKKAHLEKYGELAFNPYELSLRCVLERFYYFLNEKDETAKIYAESRGAYLDSRLELTFLDIKFSGITFGNRKIRGADIRKRLIEFKFLEKNKNISGLQIADLCATPIGRKYIGKNVKDDYKIIETKFRKYKGRIDGCGLIVIPEECYKK
ncbi:MAG: DUF3800 domain-containing protein [Actinomycetota bacterium]|nr:DUF3800 domain-containing protein [Actinomycetota bacterium]